MIPRIGDTYVHGLDRQTARGLIAAAREAGVDPAYIRTNDSGFIVPNAVWDAYERMNAPAWAEAEAVF